MAKILIGDILEKKVSGLDAAKYQLACACFYGLLSEHVGLDDIFYALWMHLPAESESYELLGKLIEVLQRENISEGRMEDFLESAKYSP